MVRVNDHPQRGWLELLHLEGAMVLTRFHNITTSSLTPSSSGPTVLTVTITRAYAIGPLNQREMVNDTVGGVPLLVTW